MAIAVPREREAAPLRDRPEHPEVHPSRLTVLEVLRDGPKSVSDVVERTGLSQPTVSMHLTCLWECGLIERERQGRFVYYRIEDPRVAVLLAAGDGLLVRVGDQVCVCTRYEG